MNEVFRRLFHAGYWLSSQEALAVSYAGLTSLRAYRRLAALSLEALEPRFPLHSKYHMLWHTFRFMQQQSHLPWQESPLADSCQMDEGFIGVISRYSRRVSPKATIERTLDVYLAALHDAWRVGPRQA